MKKSPFLVRLRYRFDNALARGPIALIGWLALAAALLVIAATGLVLLLNATTEVVPGAVFWNILSQALTPNPVDPNAGTWQYLVVMFVVTVGSLFGVSILIGVLNASISHRVESLQRGRSR